MTYIYALSDPVDGCIKYVGKTENIIRRYDQHIRDIGDTPKARWIKRLSSIGKCPFMEILEVCESKNWKRREKHWIKKFKDEGNSLLNVSSGGCGFSANDKMVSYINLYAPLLKIDKRIVDFVVLQEEDIKLDFLVSMAKGCVPTLRRMVEHLNSRNIDNDYDNIYREVDREISAFIENVNKKIFCEKDVNINQFLAAGSIIDYSLNGFAPDSRR